MFDINTIDTVTVNGKAYNTWHGSPFDRGGADAYYGRARDPHWYPEGTYKGRRREMAEMTAEEVQAYMAGYQATEDSGDRKEY